MIFKNGALGTVEGSTAPNTGDDHMLLFYLTMMFGAGVALTMLGRKWKAKR